MIFLFILLAVLYPFYNFGMVLDGRFVSVTSIISCSVFLWFLVSLINKSNQVKVKDISWSWLFLIFILFAMVGLVASPYRDGIIVKGSIQIISLLLMMGMCVSLVCSINLKPLGEFQKVLFIVLGIYALVAVLQFIFWNVLNRHTVLFFEGISDFWRWYDPGKSGSLMRVASLAAEPTHFAIILGVAVGPALVRIGVFGEIKKNKIAQFMPFWSALLIIISLALTGSINAYFLLFICCCAFFAIRNGKAMHNFGILAVVLLIISCFFWGLSQYSQTDFWILNKLKTIAFVVNPIIPKDNVSAGINTSALAITSNFSVALSNFSNNPFLGGGIGSHPYVYDKFVPEYMYNLIEYGLNKDDAASLMIRLLSETGLLGLLTFIVACLCIIIKAYKVIKTDEQQTAEDVLTQGLLSSFIGIWVLYLMRVGHYYDLSFWLVVGLIISLTNILSLRQSVPVS